MDATAAITQPRHPAGNLFADARAGALTVVNLSPIDVGYGLLMVGALGITYAGHGIAAAFLAVLVGNLVPAAFRDTGRLFAGARPAQTLLIAELVRQLVAGGAGFGAVFLHVAACTVLAGLIQAGFGLLRLGSVIKYLPIPALSGYINAVALLIVWPALMLMLGFPKNAGLADAIGGAHAGTLFNALFGGVLIGVMAVVLSRSRRIHWSVAGLFGGAALYYMTGALGGVVLGERLPEVGVMLPAWGEIGRLLRGDWPAPPAAVLAAVYPYALAVAVLNAIESLVALARHDELADSRSQANRVLVAQGIANVVGGLVGALPIAPSVSRVGIAWELGARSRRALPIAAATAAGLMIFGGPFLGLAPQTVVGALMAFLAWTMVDAWTRDQVRLFLRRRSLESSLRRQVGTNVVVMLLVVVVALAGHLIEAMFVGAVLSMFLFVRDHARSVIGRTYSGRLRRSVVMREEDEMLYLDRHGDAIQVVELDAPIVFGTADRLFGYLQNLPRGIRHLVLDFQHVREIDDKGARYLVRLARQLGQNGIDLHLAHLRPGGPRGSVLASAGLGRVLADERWHEDTDHALEAAEAALLADARLRPRESDALHDLDIAAGLDEDAIRCLEACLESGHFAAGERVFAAGMAGDRLYILVRGKVEIRLWLDERRQRQRRIAAIAPGVVFGEMAMFRQVARSADAVATQASSVRVLSADGLRRLQAEHPEVASRLMINVARQLSARLAVTNHELVYATRA